VGLFRNTGDNGVVVERTQQYSIKYAQAHTCTNYK